MFCSYGIILGSGLRLTRSLSLSLSLPRRACLVDAASITVKGEGSFHGVRKRYTLTGFPDVLLLLLLSEICTCNLFFSLSSLPRQLLEPG